MRHIEYKKGFFAVHFLYRVSAANQVIVYKVIKIYLGQTQR